MLKKFLVLIGLFWLAAPGLALALTAPLWETGQTACYNSTGGGIPCAGTGQDGEIRAGLAFPKPRFIASGECVTDNLFGLMWARNANLPNGTRTWQGALDYVASLNSGPGLCGHHDWRLPNRKELRSLIDHSQYAPALTIGHPFVNVQSDYYWSSSSKASGTYNAWIVNMWYGYVYDYDKDNTNYVWPVRSGQEGGLGPFDHFEFLNISTPQAVGVPFSLTLMAKDANGNTRIDFNGTAAIKATVGTVTPNTLDLVYGMGTGSFILNATGNDVRITASGNGKQGQSNLFNVTAGLFLPLVWKGENKPSLPLPANEITRMLCTFAGETFHYDLFIPPGYYDDPNRRYPVVFIASAGGNATMGNLEEWIRAHQWLAVMLVEAQNGPADVNDKNFLSAHDDVVQRVRVYENMKFATGVSGGARMSARFVTYRPGFRGLVLQAAGVCDDYNFCDSIELFYANKPNLYVFASFGDTDFNLDELDYLKKEIPAKRLNSEIFVGGHEAAPVETMNRAFAWIMANTLEQEYAILGKIKGDFEAVSNVTISAGSGNSTNTGDVQALYNDSTQYGLSVIGAGPYRLSASKPGCLYTPSRRLISVPPEIITGEDFEFRRCD